MKVNKAIFLVLLVFIVSCNMGGTNINYSNPYTGTEGLYMSFVDSMPPPEVYENDVFNIGISLENRGAYDISNGILNIITENDILKAKYYVKEFSLFGRNKYIANGEKKTILIPANVGKLKEFNGMNTIIIANACYEYKTFFSSPICVDPKFYDNTIKKPCYPQPVTSSGTGAPVAVVEVEPRFTTVDNDYHEEVIVPQFIIYVRKVSTGEVINPYSIERVCGNGKVDRDDYGKVYISARLGNVDLECTPNPFVLSQDSSEEFRGSVVRCRYKGEMSKDEGTHTSILNIELRYGFSQKINKRIKVLNVH